jgi:hypothetical protein
METRNVKISIQTANRWYNGTDKELKELAVQTYPELAKKELPKSWEELERIKGFVVENNCYIGSSNTISSITNRNVFATKEQAEACIALAQLSQLREVYRNGWVPDWKSFEQDKFIIDFMSNEINKSCYNTAETFLSFQDEETRDVFLENFKELIEIAKPLMS